MLFEHAHVLLCVDVDFFLVHGEAFRLVPSVLNLQP